jgi:Spy/CpxP family protein refolding chaperone
MKNPIATLLIVAGLVAVALPSTARPGFGGESMDPLDHIERMAEHLDLTADQEQQITDIVNGAQIGNAVDRERQHQIREEMRALTITLDEGRAQMLADELGEITSRLAYSHVVTMAAVRGVFTEEQLARIEELRSRRGGFRGERDEPRRGHNDAE